MVGTMVANPASDSGRVRDSLAIAEPGLNGTVTLGELGSFLVLNFDLESESRTEIVVELARALAENPEVAQVDLLTRLVDDERVSGDYAEPIEEVQPGFRIVRIAAGPSGYIFKEQLWDYLDSFVDNSLEFLRQQERLPDLIHSHYADAGYVGSRMALILDIPLVHTGHSLGRVKRRRLLASGLNATQIESRYNMARRIEAEELSLDAASLVVTSTRQEVNSQYELYDYYRPEQMKVVPPGVDLERFDTSARGDDVRTALELPSGAIVVGFLGTFTRWPGRICLCPAGEGRRLSTSTTGDNCLTRAGPPNLKSSLKARTCSSPKRRGSGWKSMASS